MDQQMIVDHELSLLRRYELRKKKEEYLMMENEMEGIGDCP